MNSDDIRKVKGLIEKGLSTDSDDEARACFTKAAELSRRNGLNVGRFGLALGFVPKGEPVRSAYGADGLRSFLIRMTSTPAGEKSLEEFLLRAKAPRIVVSGFVSYVRNMTID